MRIVFVTGLSGAGRSTAARALEDEGYHVMDNLPPSLVAEAISTISSKVERAAIVIDIRAGAITETADALLNVQTQGLDKSILFLDADDAELVHRFEGSRRPHPLQTETGLLRAIETERELLSDLRANSDLVIDSTGLSPHELRSKISAAFGNIEEVKVVISLVSFGFKRGVPIDSDLVFDARFLPNPHWDTALRPLDGRAAAVNDFVMGNPSSIAYLAAIEQVVDIVSAGYLHDGKRYLTVAIGCTGGRHRSVALVENLATRLVRPGSETYVYHRDCDRE
jgi:UPF0042 nucleotide-binding protein